MKTAVLMMQKDEATLLEPWIIHHAILFGFENLYIYDNGSKNQDCLKALSKYELLGVNVFYDKNTFEDFNTRNNDFLDKFRELQLSKGYDFYFPLDCDEFIGVELLKGVASVDKDVVHATLEKLIDSKDALFIKHTYLNNPLDSSEFKWSPKPDKVFFPNTKMVSLGNGFHRGSTESGASTTTDIVYFHFHQKCYSEYMQSAKNKLSGLVDVNDREALKNFKGPGFHLVKNILLSEFEYYQAILISKKNVPLRFIKMDLEKKYFARIGLEISESEELKKRIYLNEKFWHGYIDHVKESANGVVLTGWCVGKCASENKNFTLKIAGNELSGRIISLNSRPDVVGKFKDYPLNCGFSIIFDGLEVERLKNNDWFVYVSGDRPEWKSKLNRKDFDKYNLA